MLAFAAVGNAQTFEVLHTFPEPGQVHPLTPLILASDGNLYGTTSQGGVNDQGGIFRMTHGGDVTFLRNFQGYPADGGSSFAALLQGSDGALYGTTVDGGATDGGTVFRMTLAGAFTILHSFNTATEGGAPEAALIEFGGNFYGTTSTGGASGYGTVFRMAPNGTVSVLHAFAGGPTDGANLRATLAPGAPLVRGSDGNLYGTTHDGGVSGFGTVFRVSLPAGTFTLLHSFAGGSDGQYPSAGLLQATDGFLYGTTELGGTASAGTVFRITTGGALTILHSFLGGNDGRQPMAALVQDPTSGDFYGTTLFGGSASSYYGGRVFKMTAAGNVTQVHDFTDAEGGWCYAAVVRGSDGAYYGTTARGGDGLAGTTYKIAGDAFTRLHQFNGGSDGGRPYAPLLRGSDGNLYGNTVIGGPANWGMIFKMTPAGAFTMLHWFDAVNDSNYPVAGMVQGTDGDYYGGIQPVFYKITAAGVFTILKILANYPEGDGINTLMQATDGNFYGTTNLFGGPSNMGTIFRATPAGAITVLHTFTGGASDGGPPSRYTHLVQGADGKLYGTTETGGASNHGTVYKIATDGTGFAIVHSFNNATEGSRPQAPLILASDGNFYGTTFIGGPSPGLGGAIFKMTPAGTVTIVHAFSGAANDGAYPISGLVQAPNGTFYGTTIEGGTSNRGTVFSLKLDGTFAVVHSFAGGAAGANPVATPTLAPGGHLYGTTLYGGSAGAGMGVVFHIKLPTAPFTDDPLVAGSTVIKAVHVTELRTRIDAARMARGLSGFAWGPALATGGTIHAQHITDLRTALAQAYVAAGQTPPTYTDPGLAVGTTIRAVHISEIRTALLAIE